MSDPTVTCYKCREEVKPRVIAQRMPGFHGGEYETRDYCCDRCGPLAYWTVKIEDDLIAQLAAVKAALVEACDIADELGYGHGDIPAHRRIAHLKRIAEGG